MAQPDRHRNYDAHRAAAAARSRQRSELGRDIAPLPDVEDPRRKAACRKSLRLFLETYFPGVFRLAWSPDQLRVIEAIEAAVLRGRLKAIAMPRGSGKTSICQFAALWAALYGFQWLIAIVAANADNALAILSRIKEQVADNPLLAADFPEACYPVKRLASIAHRQRGQTFYGRPTRLVWSGDAIVFPTIRGAASSGVSIVAAGLESGRIRGIQHQRELRDGTIVTDRPGLVLIDDPQTRESARSPMQCDLRESLIAGDILGMAGPGQRIAGLLTCTVIRRGDVADRILDRKANPEWGGERCRMIYAFPERLDLWDKYWDLRSAELIAGGDGSGATAFYVENREAMDLGARVAWPARFAAGDASALQTAMDLYYRNRQEFQSEYQNEPDEEAQTGDVLPAEEIAGRVNRLRRGVLPANAEILTASIDIQQKALFWLVLASAADGTAAVVDYGTWPDQARRYFTLADIRSTLARKYPKAGVGGAIYNGLVDLCADLFTREWTREDGAPIGLRRCLVDANWGESTDAVYTFCRQTKHRGLVLPSHGRFYGATSRGLAEQATAKGELVGDHWKIAAIRPGKPVRAVVIDTNYWKTTAHHALTLSPGDRGNLTFWGDDRVAHRMIADHLSAEAPNRATSAAGRTVDEWRAGPNRADNHFFDCLVGAMAAASIEGARRVGETAAAIAGGKPKTTTARRRSRVRYSE